MTISTVVPYAGDVPLRVGQTQNEFSNNTGDMLEYIAVYVPEVNITVGEINAAVVGIDAGVISAEDSATAAEASALSAASSLSSVSGTSTTSNTIEAGVKVWITQTGKGFAAGQYVRVSDATDAAANFIEGTVTAYMTGTGTISVEVEKTGGAGTLSDWVITTTAKTLSIAQVMAFSLLY